jgi:hypothetical protein
MNIDLKTSLLLGALTLAMVSYFYSTTIDMNVLDLELRALRTENNCIRTRLDLLDEEVNKLNKRIWTVKNEEK